MLRYKPMPMFQTHWGLFLPQLNTLRTLKNHPRTLDSSHCPIHFLSSPGHRWRWQTETSTWKGLKEAGREVPSMSVFFHHPTELSGLTALLLYLFWTNIVGVLSWLTYLSSSSKGSAWSLAPHRGVSREHEEVWPRPWENANSECLFCIRTEIWEVQRFCTRWLCAYFSDCRVWSELPDRPLIVNPKDTLFSFRMF